MYKSAILVVGICGFLANCGISTAQDATSTRLQMTDQSDSELLNKLVTQARGPSTGTFRFQTRLRAIDLIGDLGKGLDTAVDPLKTLLNGENLVDAEKLIYFQHVLQTAGKIGWPARKAFAEILAVSSVDIALDPYVKQAVDDILKVNPSNKSAAATQPPTAAAQQQPSAPTGGGQAAAAALTLADVNKQLADINKAISTAATSLDKLSKQLDTQLNPKPAAQ